MDFLSMQARFYTSSFAISHHLQGFLFLTRIDSLFTFIWTPSPNSSTISKLADDTNIADQRISESQYQKTYTELWTSQFPGLLMPSLYMKIDPYIFHCMTILCIFYIGMDTTVSCNKAVICPCYTSSSPYANCDRIQPRHDPDCRISGGWMDKWSLSSSSKIRVSPCPLVYIYNISPICTHFRMFWVLSSSCLSGLASIMGYTARYCREWWMWFLMPIAPPSTR